MIPFLNHDLPPVTHDEMAALYEKLKTPVKLGPVMKWDNDFTDSPTVFRYNGKFWMYFIAISRDVSVSGYETHLASSDDLIHWDYVGPIFRRNNLDRWDSKQCAGYAAYMDIRYDGTAELQPVNGSYYISYLAGNSDGYEPDPLFMGLAKTENPTDPDGFTRFPEPILTPHDADARALERRTLFKSFLFRDEAGITGHPYVNVYNAKDPAGRERIFLAVSDDGESWERYGDGPVLDLMTNDPTGRITGDPQIVKVDELYVMLFFHYKGGKPAFDTFAASRDLIHWTVWDGEPLIDATLPFENVHAHKPWFVRWQGKNYHFYCACNDKGERFIALAVSE